MRIIRIEPESKLSNGKFETVASFDVQVTDDIRLCGMRLARRPDGGFITWPPASGGRRLATFAPELAAAITQAACNAFYGGHAIAGTSYTTR